MSTARHSEKLPARYGIRRFIVLYAFAAIVGCLIWRGIDLQISRGEFLEQQGEARFLRHIEVSASRGNIFDRNGKPLAMSTPVDSIWVNPRELDVKHKKLSKLFATLKLNGDRTLKELKARSHKSFHYLRRHVTPQIAARVRQLAIPGIHYKREYKRFYPAGALAGQVVGFTNIDDKGQEGLELAFENRLAGLVGKELIIRDENGRGVQSVAQIKAPRPGQDLILSIDGRIQYIAYKALSRAIRKHSARAGSAVVLDAKNGDVLAMVNEPTFNPNKGSDRIAERYRNRAVTDTFEPGSTLKPFTIMAALASGQYAMDSVIDTHPGNLLYAGHKITDPKDYGLIDLGTIIKKSSNVGVSKVAMGLKPRQMGEVFDAFGLGQLSGSGFPGEVGGDFEHYSEWGALKKITLSYGYGGTVTALQLARAYIPVANNGMMVDVSFQKNNSNKFRYRVVAPSVASTVRAMLGTVIQTGGTGGLAAVAGYRVGGKTGTARKVTNGKYSSDRLRALFTGMAPLEKPRLIIVVVIDEPSGEHYSGGKVAAPVFAEIAQDALRLIGEMPVYEEQDSSHDKQAYVDGRWNKTGPIVPVSARKISNAGSIQ